MPIVAEWDDVRSKRIIVVRLTTRWEWDEYHAAMLNAQGLAQSVPYRVGLLFDVPTGMKPPDNYLSHLGEYIRGRRMVNSHTIIITTPDTLTEMLTEALIKAYGNDHGGFWLGSATDVQEARLFILQRAEKLGMPRG